jgi:hypothetical protein
VDIAGEVQPYAEAGKQWEIVDRTGPPGAMAPTSEKVYTGYATASEAVDHLNARTYDWRENLRLRWPRRRRLWRAEAQGTAWVVDIPEKFAAEMHAKGSPLFQRRRGSVLGLTRLTEDGADIYLNRESADITTWVEEGLHAVAQKWFDDADARGDGRADHVREYLNVEPGEVLPMEANEQFVRLGQAWIHDGATLLRRCACSWRACPTR